MRGLLALGLVTALTAGVAVGGGDKRQAGKLDGTWISEKDGKKAVTMTFTKDAFTLTMHFGEKDSTFKGTFKADPAKKPTEVDLKITEGAMFVGDTSLGIYELKGDTLKWAGGTPGKGARPKEFPANEGFSDAGLYLVFKRAK